MPKKKRVPAIALAAIGPASRAAVAANGRLAPNIRKRICPVAASKHSSDYNIEREFDLDISPTGLATTACRNMRRPDMFDFDGYWTTFSRKGYRIVGMKYDQPIHAGVTRNDYGHRQGA